MRTLTLSASDCHFAIQCPDAATAALLSEAFGGLLVASTKPVRGTAEAIRILRTPSGHGFQICGPDGHEHRFEDSGGLLLHLDKRLIISLQERRSDLYFIHAAAVALGDRVAVLAAPPGTGKSTLTLALLEKGFGYLSDELTAVDPGSLVAYPYPRAVCLKSDLPRPLRLPEGTLQFDGRLYIPPRLFSGGHQTAPLPVAAFFFLRRNPLSSIVRRPVSASAAAAYLMANSLNALAHEGDGLDVAVTVSQKIPAFELDCHDLDAASAEIEAVLKQAR